MRQFLRRLLSLVTVPTASPALVRLELTPAFEAAAKHHSTALLTAPAPELDLTLVMLDGGAAADVDRGRFDRLWRSASTKLVADGAANQLHDRLGGAAREAALPDLILGDLDSLRADVAAFYRARGVRVETDADQDTHDFEKCVRWLEERARREPSARRPTVVAHGALRGRLDHMLAQLDVQFGAAERGALERLLLLSEHSVAFVLGPGKHVIHANPDADDGSCGLLPLGGRCESVRTRGLRWDLDGSRALQFGAFISSSNALAAPTIAIETSGPLLWTSGLRGGG
eukprot:gene8111-2112_t